MRFFAAWFIHSHVAVRLLLLKLNLITVWLVIAAIVNYQCAQKMRGNQIKIDNWYQKTTQTVIVIPDN